MQTGADATELGTLVLNGFVLQKNMRREHRRGGCVARGEGEGVPPRGLGAPRPSGGRLRHLGRPDCSEAGRRQTREPGARGRGRMFGPVRVCLKAAGKALEAAMGGSVAACEVCCAQIHHVINTEKPGKEPVGG